MKIIQYKKTITCQFLLDGVTTHSFLVTNMILGGLRVGDVELFSSLKKVEAVGWEEWSNPWKSRGGWDQPCQHKESNPSEWGETTERTRNMTQGKKNNDDKEYRIT